MALRNASTGSTPTSKGTSSFKAGPGQGSKQTVKPPGGGGSATGSPGPVQATSPRADAMGVAQARSVPNGSTESLGLSGPMGAMRCEDMAYGSSPDGDYDD